MQLHPFAQELRNTELNYSCGSINVSLNGKVSLACTTGPEENTAEENSFLFISLLGFFPLLLTLLTGLQLFKDFPLF